MLSIAIIACNAQATLKKCLESVAGISNDIVVVVDTRSKDSTAMIAKTLDCRVNWREFDDFSSQKNFATSLCRHDWVLSLDADEEVSPSLSKEIADTLLSPKFDAYSMPRVNYIFGKVINHTNWSPESDRHVWLFNRTKAQWVGKIHEHVQVNGSIGRLTQPKIHFNYSSVEQFLTKMNFYTSIEAKEKNQNWLLLTFFYPLWKFARHFIFYRGFLDGWHGLFLSYLMGVYGLSVAVKSWAKKKRFSF